MKARLFTLACGMGLAALGVIAWAQTARVLVINSKVASTDVRMINGRAYAPISDIAKALDLAVVTRDNGFELTRKGGAGPVQGLQGKIGDWLFDGGWRFRVERVTRTQRWELRNEWYGETEATAGDDQELIIVEYSYRNGNKDLAHFNFEEAFLSTPSGATEKTYSNDFAYDGARSFAKALLPGAEAKGAFIFRVSQGFEYKELIMKMGELATYDEAVRPKQRSVFRISLAEKG